MGTMIDEDGSAVVAHAIPEPVAEPPRGPLAAWAVAVTALHCALFAPVPLHALYRPEIFPSLYGWHVDETRHTFRTLWEPGIADLWHTSVRLVNVLAGGSDLRFGAAVTQTAAYAGFGLAVFLVMQSRSLGPAALPRTAAVLMSVAVLMFEAPSAALGYERIADSTTSFLSLYITFIPTTIGSMGLDVAAVWLATAVISGKASPRAARWTPVVMALATLAKPNLTPPFIAAVVIAMLAVPEVRSRAKAIVARVVLPVLVIGGSEYALLVTSVPMESRGGWGLRPLVELRYLGALRVEYWLVLLFPIVAIALVGRRLIRDPAVAILLVTLSISLVAVVLLGRVGETNYRGDVAQLVQASVAMLIIFMIRRLLILWRSGRVRLLVASLLVLSLLPYLAAGGRTWVCHSGLRHCYDEMASAR